MNSFPFFCAPALEYLAPEYILDKRCGPESDVFSLGCLLYALHSNDGKSPLECGGNLHLWNEKVGKLGSVPYFEIRGDAAGLIRRMISRTGRIGLGQVEGERYFDDVLVGTITFLDSFAEKGMDKGINLVAQSEKVQFLKGMVRVLPEFSTRYDTLINPRLMKQKLLPKLLEELKDKQLIPFILPNLFWILDRVEPHEFVSIALPRFKDIFKIIDPPQSVCPCCIYLVRLSYFFLEWIYF
jgi:SCY1-like protein 2